VVVYAPYGVTVVAPAQRWKAYESSPVLESLPVFIVPTSLYETFGVWQFTSLYSVYVRLNQPADPSVKSPAALPPQY
jgi:hypothetical protein